MSSPVGPVRERVWARVMSWWIARERTIIPLTAKETWIGPFRQVMAAPTGAGSGTRRGDVCTDSAPGGYVGPVGGELRAGGAWSSGHDRFGTTGLGGLVVSTPPDCAQVLRARRPTEISSERCCSTRAF